MFAESHARIPALLITFASVFGFGFLNVVADNVEFASKSHEELATCKEEDAVFPRIARSSEAADLESGDVVLLQVGLSFPKQSAQVLASHRAPSASLSNDATHHESSPHASPYSTITTQTDTQFQSDTVKANKIPNNLLFNYKTNLLRDAATNEYEARSLELVQKIIASHPGAMTVFYDDLDCRAAIARVHSEALARYFDNETEGFFKSDTCRLAMLFEWGGYYFDNDMDLIKDLRVAIPSDASFSTVLESPDRVHNGFMASAPGHPVLRNALDVTSDWYENRYMNGLSFQHSFPQYYKDKFDLPNDLTEHWGYLLGPDTLAVGLMMWGGVNRLQPSRMFDPASQDFVFFLKNGNPDDYGIPRRTGPGCCSAENNFCNRAMIDTETSDLVGWTRSMRECCPCSCDALGLGRNVSFETKRRCYADGAYSEHYSGESLQGKITLAIRRFTL